MFRCSVMVVLLSFVVPVSADDQHAPAESGMTTIFNGTDLASWDGDPQLWSVKDGVIHGETTADVKANGNTFLIWKDGMLKDFELRLSFRCSASNNSGIQYRSKHITDGKVRNKWVVRGYQHEIRNENKLPNVSGFIYDEGGATGGRGRIILVGQKGAWMGDSLDVSGDVLITAEEYEKLFHLNEWNDVVIRAQGNHIQHYMNGRLVMDFTDSDDRALTEGILALQLHAGKPMFAEFKDIRVKHLK